MSSDYRIYPDNDDGLDETMIDSTYWRDRSSGDRLQFDFALPSYKSKRTKVAQSAIISSLEAAHCEADTEVPGWLRLARQLPDGLRAALIAELRAGNPLLCIESMGWPSEGSIVATMGERFTVARRAPPAGVVWCGHDKEPHSWREDLSQKVGKVHFLLMT